MVFLLLQAPFTGVAPSFVECHALLEVIAGVGAFGLIDAGVLSSSSSLDSPNGERWVLRCGEEFVRVLFQDMDE